MPELTLTPLAQSDIKAIGRYAQETWGVAQRNDYLKSIAETFEHLREGFIAGRTREEIRTNLLSSPCQEHVIFFRRTHAGHVEVLRILHARMDFANHLEIDP